VLDGRVERGGRAAGGEARLEKGAQRRELGGREDVELVVGARAERAGAELAEERGRVAERLGLVVRVLRRRRRRRREAGGGRRAAAGGGRLRAAAGGGRAGRWPRRSRSPCACSRRWP
jgi:hypothetical protein